MSQRQSCTYGCIKPDSGFNGSFAIKTSNLLQNFTSSFSSIIVKDTVLVFCLLFQCFGWVATAAGSIIQLSDVSSFIEFAM
jgi:hypothetical protein